MANPSPAPTASHSHNAVAAAASSSNLAVFAADLAISLPLLAAILPLLPPRTPNDELSWAANRLECGVHTKDDLDHNVKSGKNGNVD
jgi:hypothetical protein